MKNQTIPNGIIPSVSIENAIAKLQNDGHWPTRGNWPVADAESDAYLLRVFAGQPVEALQSYLA